MHCRLMVEDIEANHWIAWVADLPGCYNAAKTWTEAIDLGYFSASLSGGSETALGGTNLSRADWRQGSRRG